MPPVGAAGALLLCVKSLLQGSQQRLPRFHLVLLGPALTVMLMLGLLLSFGDSLLSSRERSRRETGSTSRYCEVDLCEGQVAPGAGWLWPTSLAQMVTRGRWEALVSEEPQHLQRDKERAPHSLLRPVAGGALKAMEGSGQGSAGCPRRLHGVTTHQDSLPPVPSASLHLASQQCSCLALCPHPCPCVVMARLSCMIPVRSLFIQTSQARSLSTVLGPLSGSRLVLLR